MIQQQQEVIAILQEKHQDAVQEAARQRQRADQAQPDHELLKAVNSGRATQVRVDAPCDGGPACSMGDVLFPKSGMCFGCARDAEAPRDTRSWAGGDTRSWVGVVTAIVVWCGVRGEGEGADGVQTPR